MIHNILSIAGTDPTGGAGIHADLKTFSAAGTYGMAVITAVVAQNTQGVRSFEAMRPELVADQIDAVFEDVRVDAVKIGMLANADIVNVVADRLKFHKAARIVLDPVMVAKSGDALLSRDAVEAVRASIVPISTVITPNLPEAAVLLDVEEPAHFRQMEGMMPGLLSLGSSWVLLKGGHMKGDESVDLLAGPNFHKSYSAKRVRTTNDHGTGCTLAAAIAAYLPGSDVPTSVARAKDYLLKALLAADRLEVGGAGGHGPVHHHHAWF